MKKGISPIISSVLMIAFVVAIGIAVSQWSDKLISGSIEKSQSKIGTDLECANVNIRLSSDPSGKLVIMNNNKEGLEINGFISRFVMQDETVLVDYANQEKKIIKFGAELFDYKNSQKKSINEDNLNVDADKISQIEIIPRVEIGNNEIVNCESKKVKFRL